MLDSARGTFVRCVDDIPLLKRRRCSVKADPTPVGGRGLIGGAITTRAIVGRFMDDGCVEGEFARDGLAGGGRNCCAARPAKAVI